MQTQKMSLADIKGKLSRAEMKNIMAGLVRLSGTRYSEGSCYCDWTITMNGTTRTSCDNPCRGHYCGH